MLPEPTFVPSWIVIAIARHVGLFPDWPAIPHPDSSVAPVVTESVGVASMQPVAGRGSATDLVGAADRALYLAKESGRNCVKVASA